MRQKNETATSFNQLKELTQAIQAQKRSAQTSENASQSKQTPKTRACAKNHALKPTKRAFSERQKTTIRDKSQASANERLESEQRNQQDNNANAFKSDEAFKQGLKNTQDNKKGASDEA
ncbi:hypothetical protein ACLGAV_07935 [Helicobacter pylori]